VKGREGKRERERTICTLSVLARNGLESGVNARDHQRTST
jgi:hypothetical protein